MSSRSKSMRQRSLKHKLHRWDNEKVSGSKKVHLNDDVRLHKAISSDDLLAVREILEHKDRNLSTLFLHEVLLKAIKEGKKQIVRLLFSHDIYVKGRSKIGCLALIAAAKQGNLDIVKLLIRKGVCVNGKDSSGKTALMAAVENNCSSALITFLLENCKADVNLQDNEGKTVLMLAVEQWDYEIVQILFFGNDEEDVKEYNCDEKIKDKKGHTALDLAELNGSADLMNLLSKSRKRFCSPLAVAAALNDFDLVRKLVEIHPACVDSVCYGDDPLTVAMHGDGDDRERWDGKIHGSFELIEFLIHAGVNVDGCHLCGLTPLMFAASAGSAKIVKLLLNHKLQLDDRSYEVSDLDIYKRRTALMLAAQNGNVKIVAMLIQAGANLKLEDDDGQTALTLAIRSKHKNCVLALLKKWERLSTGDIVLMADFNLLELLKDVKDRWEVLFKDSCDLQAILCKAVQTRCFQLVRFLITLGAKVTLCDDLDEDYWFETRHILNPINSALDDVDMLSLLVEMGADINFQPKYGKSALMEAASSGNIKHVLNLLKCNADMYATQYDSTALSMASMNGHIEVVEALLGNGMDVNYVSNNKTALWKCLYYKKYHAMELLIKHGANVDSDCPNGSKVLMHAVLNNPLNFSELLIKSGASVNIQDTSGNTALFYALMINKRSIDYEEKISLLLQHGANVNLVNGTMKTPLMVAVELSDKYNNALKVLLDYQPDMNAQDINGDTAAHFAVKKGSIENLVMLADKGADLNIVNHENRSPLMLAFRLLRCHMVKSLLRFGATINKNKLYAVRQMWKIDFNHYLRKICRKGTECCHYFDFLGCVEALFEGACTLHGLPPSYLITLLLILIQKNEFKPLAFLVKNGAGPSVVNLSSCVFHIQFDQKVIIDVASVCNLRVSPMCLAILVGWPKIVALFSQTYFYVQEDVKMLQHVLIKEKLSQMVRQHSNIVCNLDDFCPEKWSLRTWSKLAVLRLIGYGEHRQQRVRTLPIPRGMQNELLYSNVSFNM